MYSIQTNKILLYSLYLCYVCCLSLFYFFLSRCGGASLTTGISFHNTSVQGTYLRLLSFLAVWLIGIFLGYCLACKDTTFSESLLLSIVLQPISIAGLFTCVFLPFLISHYIYISGNRPFLLFICFIKAVSFSYSWTIVANYFRSAAWLIAFLLMFSDIFSLILLLHFWYACVIDAKSSQKYTYCIHLLLLIVFSLVDYGVIVPFMQKLF